MATRYDIMLSALEPVLENIKFCRRRRKRSREKHRHPDSFEGSACGGTPGFVVVLAAKNLSSDP